MSNAPVACGACEVGGLCGGKGLATFKSGVWANNPISVQVLGICSALAVTSKMENAIVMGLALIFVTGCSNLFISLLRKAIPRKIRMIAEVAIIATFVILFDQLLRAFYYDMSKTLGPYVGLIITNCIVMGRAEAFALQNPPLVSVVDGLANGMGYAGVLAVIGAIRELLGSGTVLGFTVLSTSWYVPNQVMILAPGAFVVLGFLIALFNAINAGNASKDAKPAGGH
jgi:Na+-transporting NADH:ubiquinone oxidoreductase subunit D